MVIVETRKNPSILNLFFKVFRAVECVHVRRVEDGTADREVQLGVPPKSQALVLVGLGQKRGGNLVAGKS